MTTTQSPAARLAAVLVKLKPSHSFTTDASGIVRSMSWPRNEIYLSLDPTSKDDLARVVAMLSGEQLVELDRRLRDQVLEGCPRGQHGFAWILAAPASTWLDALCAATGVK